MRNSFSRLTMTVAVAICVTAVALTGCSTGSSFKMPGSDWFSWGKKKPSASTLGANTPSRNLPSPPSTATTPNPAPSYAQTTPPRPATPAGIAGGAIHPSMAAAPGAYGTHGAGSGYYSNATYGNPTTGTNAGYTGYESPTRSAPAVTQGYYSPGGYNDRQIPPTTGGYGTAASPGSYGSTYGTPANTAGMNQGYGQNFAPAGRESYNPYAQADRGAASAAGPTANAQPTAYGPTSSYAAPPPAYGQPSGNAASYDPAPRNAPGGGYGAAASGSAPGGYADSSNQGPPPAAATGGAYRPGSTGRSTRFGNSEQLNVSNAEGVRSASFNTGNDATGSPSVYGNPSTYGGASSYTPSYTR
jgi:hypothetical protein